MVSTVVLREDIYLEDVYGVIPTLAITPQNGFVLDTINFGSPDIRDASSNRPQQNGSLDYTQYFGARSITFSAFLATELQADPLVTDQVLEDKLRRWGVPSVRAWLYYRPSPTATYRRMLVRPSNTGSGSRSMSTRASFRNVLMSFRGIEGSWEGVTLNQESLNPSVSVELGRTYDQTYDKTYAASSVIGTKTLTVEGNVLTFPIIRIFGPCTGPRIENVTTGEKLEFLAAYSLIAGEFLLIDAKEGTVYLDGLSTNSRYDKIDFASGISRWWGLRPGLNDVRYYPLTSSSPSVATIEWRGAYV